MAETNSIDPSSLKPIVKWSEEWWANAEPEVAAHRCTAHSTRTGERCKRVSMNNQRVCATHGGRASQAKHKARQRIEEAEDRTARELLGIATGAEGEAVRLAAIRDALDRASLAAKTAVAVEVGPTKPYETIFEQIEGGSRAAYRRGDDDKPPALPSPPHELPPADDAPIDAEVLDDKPDAREFAARMMHPRRRRPGRAAAVDGAAECRFLGSGNARGLRR